MRQFSGSWNNRRGNNRGRPFRGGNQNNRNNEQNPRRQNNNNRNPNNNSFKRSQNQNQNQNQNTFRQRGTMNRRGGSQRRGRDNQQNFRQQPPQRIRRQGFKQQNQNVIIQLSQQGSSFRRTGRQPKINSEVLKIAKDIHRKNKMEQALNNYWKKSEQQPDKAPEANQQQK